jgi:hypothetical protein
MGHLYCNSRVASSHQRHTASPAVFFPYLLSNPPVGIRPCCLDHRFKCCSSHRSNNGKRWQRFRVASSPPTSLAPSAYFNRLQSTAVHLEQMCTHAWHFYQTLTNRFHPPETSSSAAIRRSSLLSSQYSGCLMQVEEPFPSTISHKPTNPQHQTLKCEAHLLTKVTRSLCPNSAAFEMCKWGQ